MMYPLANVAQLAAHRPCNPVIVGSTPTVGSNTIIRKHQAYVKNPAKGVT